ncbi:hypothetical protein G7Z17_g6807 [Cylindrodendrum hubeiense]|uniref:Zn(2)-C6 fungal-type domain-containing protein n=1 Tax=Cylindrodendrum hubeiense TaxID=595255 RepID=A0A9P5LFY2_9HYPO|nr:hypothetical protein G7Z17_g6807 [Cylindrodendrum hubeiense]
MDAQDTDLDPVYVGVFGNRGGPRSRTGCHTCRRRKVKCDETKPVCRRCARLSRPCDWSSPRSKRRDDLAASISASDQGRQSYQISLAEPCTVARDASAMWAGASSQLRFSWDSDMTLFANTSLSGLCLGPTDHAAIMLYRSTFVSLHDTKNPTYSVPSIIFQIGVSSALIMHMVLAIGMQHLAALGDGSRSQNNALSTEAVRHYCEAIRLLGQAINGSLPCSELNTVLAALWMMVVYEQHFGHDSTGQGLCQHLQGATSVLHANLPSLLSIWASENEQPVAEGHPVGQVQNLPYLTSRLLVRLTVLDARAASFGLGGKLNQSLAQSMGLGDPSQKEVPWFHFLSAIYDHSAPLCQATWGTEYPSAEVAYDAENQAAFHLYRYCSTLRLTAAEIRTSGREASSLIRVAEPMMNFLQKQYSELFSIAAGISSSTSEDKEGLIMTLCWIVPHYYGSVLDLSRIIDMDRPESRRIEARERILKLAYYGWEHGGAAAISRMAWPLFMAALETDDNIHQDWILSRFEQLSCFGVNYRKAHQWLKSRMRDMRRNIALDELEFISPTQINQFML